ncbi:cyclin-dependent kinase inhibitor 3-like [Mytilus galloprovincialis]|uniref:cyclin-dependent kinase inhibitor 3-like n=1 Tax=Mytilus galloprovincialis TaxID=29158 RepID=UPI003F7C923A
MSKLTEKMKVKESQSASNLDSSDEEQGELDMSPLKVSWLDLSSLGCDEPVGICALPGCRFKDIWRSLENDIKCLVSEGVKEVFCLCSKGELNKYRVPKLIGELQENDITVHHTPFPDGLVPSTSELIKIIDDLHVVLMNRRKTIIHCYGGLGRSSFLAAALMMKLDSSLEADKAIEIMRELRGPAAVQSVKQYNCLHDLRQQIADHEAKMDESKRSLSR